MKYFKHFPTLTYDGKEVTDIFSRGKIRDLVIEKIELFYRHTLEDEMRPDTLSYQYYDDYDPVWAIFFANAISDPFHDWLLSYEDFKNYLIDKYGVDSPKAIKSSLGTLTSVTTVGTSVTFDSSNRYTPVRVLEILEAPDTPQTRRVIQVVSENEFIIDSPFNVNYTNVDMNIYTDVHSYYDADGDQIDYDTWLLLPFSDTTVLTIFDHEVRENESKRNIRLLRSEFINKIQRELQELFS